MIEEALIKEGVKNAFKIAVDFLSKNDFKIASSEKDIEKSLMNHITQVKNWSGEIIFKDLKKAKRTQEVYIRLNTYIYPRRNRIYEDEKIEEIDLLEVFKIELNHIILLGQPGAGKTTSTKFICQSLFFDEDFYPAEFKYPILIRLREFNKPLPSKNSKIIIDYIYNLLSIESLSKNGINYDIGYSKKEELVVEILNSLQILLIIEGFDELGYKRHRDLVLEEIASLATKLETSRMMMTSRTADYYFSFEGFSEYEICPLSAVQIVDFASKWLGNEESAIKFLHAINDSPFSDTTIRPITVAHLCAIFERIDKIPEKPKTVYRKIINLLLEEWDEQRNIRRDSMYAKFETDRKFEFLTNLAFHMTGGRRRTTFSQNDLKRAYDEIHQDFDLDSREVFSVISELESHTGLFVKSGFELYEFAHKSLQEYLTAEYIVRLPTIPEIPFYQFPNEFAIAVAISSNSSLYFSELVRNMQRSKGLTRGFYQTFINRLLLEKPEFTQNESLVASALILYSLTLSSSTENSQLYLFIEDSLIAEFEEFIDEVSRRNSINDIFKNYRVEAKEQSTHGTTVLSLILNNKQKSGRYKLPLRLKSRETFFQDNS